MYEYIRGKLVEIGQTKVIVEAESVAYGLFIPLNHFSNLPRRGEEILLYVAFVVREDSHTFYGFLSSAHRDLFLACCEVSGIGPKLALALVGYLELPDLFRAISQSEIALLCKIPGVGRKTAERLVIEMRDRIGAHVQRVQANTCHTVIGDAINALIHLGYNALQAQKAVHAAAESKPDAQENLSALIAASLRCI